MAAFIKKAVKSVDLISKVGLLETTELFTLIYDPLSSKFYLSLCYGDGELLSYTYDKLEFAKWPAERDVDEPDWDVQSVTEEILGDIEEATRTWPELLTVRGYYNEYYDNCYALCNLAFHNA